MAGVQLHIGGSAAPGHCFVNGTRVNAITTLSLRHARVDGAISRRPLTPTAQLETGGEVQLGSPSFRRASL